MGRDTSEIVDAFEKVPKVLKQSKLGIEGHSEDLCHYIRQHLCMSGAADFRESIIERVVNGPQNNSLVGTAKIQVIVGQC